MSGDATDAGPDAGVIGNGAPSVLHVTTIDASLEFLLLPQLMAFRAAGYEVSTASAPGPHAERLRELGFRHEPLHHATRAVRPIADIRTLIELVRVLRVLRPTILHTHTPKLGIIGRLAGRIARVPIVVNTVHGLWVTEDDPVLRRILVLALERFAAAFSDRELVQSREDLSTLRRWRVPERRLVLLGNGIDLARFDRETAGAARNEVRDALGLRVDDVLVGFVGRLVDEKGLPEIVVAARRLSDAPIRFVLIGPDEPDKADRFAADDLPGNIRAVGMRDDVERWYAAMDLLVLPSHREGFPRAPMEAAAMGVPTIATDVRGCREAVVDGVTGILVPVRDAVALERSVRLLSSNTELRERLGRTAVCHARANFDVVQQISVTIDVYDDLRGRRR